MKCISLALLLSFIILPALNCGDKKEDDHMKKAQDAELSAAIDRWLEDPCKEHISILGEFGTGKTWFTHHYAYQLMKKYLEAKEKGLKRPRLPLGIQLRDYSKALNSESLFSDFFFRKHEVPLPGYSAFEQLNRMGKLLLIFDGFDEAPIIVRFDLECFQELFNIRILTAAVIDTLLNALNRLDNLVVVRFQESDVKGYDPGAGTGKFLNQLDEF